MIDYTKPVRTKGGLEVVIFTTKANGDFPVLWQFKDGGNPEVFYSQLNGANSYSSELNLVNVSERIQRTVWVNLYPGVNNCSVGHKNKFEADSRSYENRIACIKVEIDCEEGEGLNGK